MVWSGPGGRGVSAMLTPDHPGLNWFPQDLRNPGAALSDRPVGQGLRRDATSAQEVGLGPPGNSGDAGGTEGCPKSAPSPAAQPILPLCSPTGWRPVVAQQACPFLFLQDPVCGGMQLLQLPQPVSHAPSRTLPLSSPTPPTPNAVSSCLVPWNPRRLGNAGMCDA